MSFSLLSLSVTSDNLTHHLGNNRKQSIEHCTTDKIQRCCKEKDASDEDVLPRTKSLREKSSKQKG